MGRSIIRRLGAGLLAVVAVSAGLVFTSATASATTYPEVTPLPDSSLHTYCFTAGFSSSPDPSVGHYAMQVLDSQTDFTISDLGACSDNNTDVWWFSLNLAAGIRGQYQCMLTAAGRCNRADVRIDFAEIDAGDFDWEDRRKTAVHEVGHSVGLGHHSPAAHNCTMISGEIPDTSLQWRRYHAHDVDHINAAF
jgi:hypothetical protein